MKLSELHNSITDLPGIGSSTAKFYAKLGVFSAGDLLSHFPRDWEDRTRVVPLADFAKFPKVHTVAKIVAHEWFGFGRMKTLKVIIDDTTARAALVCFNRPFFEKTCPVGALAVVTAKFSTSKYGEIQATSFDSSDIQILSRSGEIDPLVFAQKSERHGLPGSGVFPIYALTAGLSQKILRKNIASALTTYGKNLDDEIPVLLREKHSLLSKSEAIRKIHQPTSLADVEAARKTLIFEELFLFQEALAKRSLERRGFLPDGAESLQGEVSESLENGGLGGEISDEEFEKNLSPRQKALFKSLSFSLTRDQKKVILQLRADFARSRAQEERPFSMARLLQGDVGSGKTLAAFFACLEAIDFGGQCAILAPTELLARQHAENAAKVLEKIGVNIAFLTGNVKAAGRNALIAALKKGEVDLVVGTHALFSQGAVYKSLDFVVIDEQHRFGVRQRDAILNKGRKIRADGKAVLPNLLMMSATPIPQTLALTVFSDLDVSTIKTMPQGRLPVKTHLAQEGREQKVYDFVRAQLEAGRQAYFVYPLIAESDSDAMADLKNAEKMLKVLSEKQFPSYQCALIHSEIDEERQKKIMDDFRSGKIKVLVATSVIEVGVDVPNATCIVIEQAERFGLAALHQLRGRVGRSDLQSHCFLVYGKNLTEIAKERLKTLYESTDGFFIAEQDLVLRGPGEVLGTQQSGFMRFSIADPIRDREIMQTARIEAVNLVRESENLPN